VNEAGMAWTDYIGGLGEILPSRADSARFGYAISRVTVGAQWRDSAATVDELAHDLWSRIEADPSDVVFIRYPSELISLPAAGAGLPGWTLLPAGTLVYWSYDVSDAPQHPLPEDIDLIVQNGGSDAALFLEALEDSFTDYPSHYSANPLFDAGLVAAGYREWAETTLSDPTGRLYGLREAGTATGVAVTRALDGGRARTEIELAGIIGRAQGRGRYRYLLEAIARDAAADQTATVVISTQSGNIRVQRSWAAAGYKPERSIDTVHAVRSSLLAAVGAPTNRGGVR
jgi:hypothetical protein